MRKQAKKGILSTDERYICNELHLIKACMEFLYMRSHANKLFDPCMHVAHAECNTNR
jgi:hypothetical protein